MVKIEEYNGYTAQTCGKRVIIHDSKSDVRAIIMTATAPTEDMVLDILRRWTVFVEADG